MASQDEKLLSFVSTVAGEGHLQVEEDLGKGFIRLRVTEAERRQAKHDIRSVEDGIIEMLRNSRDAGSSKIFFSASKEENKFRKIVLIDDGEGIPKDYHLKIFEPRVTSRLDTVIFDKYGLHGRGLALFSLKSIVKQILVVSSLPGKGSIFKVNIDLGELPERQDQSTFPLVKSEGTRFVVKGGVRNIPRVLTEFNLAHPELELYFGSPTEILRTMRYLSRARPRDKNLADPKTIASALEGETFLGLLAENGLSLWEGAGLVEDAASLKKLANTHYGLEISLRNAYRVAREEIEPVASLLEIAKEKQSPAKKRAESGENLAQLIPDEELAQIGTRLKEELTAVMAKYFLRVSKEPRTLRFKNQLKVVVELETDEDV